MSNIGTQHPEFFKPAAGEETPEAAVVTPPVSRDIPAVIKKPSNRATAAGVAVLGGVIFAVLLGLAAWAYSAAAWVYGGSSEGVAADAFIYDRTITFLITPMYWLTVIGFTVYFVLLAVIVNTGKWRSFVLWGLLVAVLTYLTAIGSGLLTVSAWTLTFDEALDFVWRSVAFNPLVLVAVVLSREIPIWLGGWIALKGRKLRQAPTSV